ncbi:MAG TPA: hypothetical protein DCE80_19500 [Ignavibacteriales bacterium]|nr:hypothetical protein [Ignavibacteriales bacterium]
MKKIYVHIVLFLVICITSICNAQITRDQCYLCHSNPTLQKTITVSGGTEIIPLYVDSLQYNSSLHHALECVACHTDINSTNLFSHTLSKNYGSWARFSKSDTTSNGDGSPRTRNYYTAASMSCNKSGCHPTKAAYDTSNHHQIWRLKTSKVRMINGENAGENYDKTCSRCHATCATCHFKAQYIQKYSGDLISIWDSLHTYGEGPFPNAAAKSEWSIDWTTNVVSHNFWTSSNLQSTNDICRSCHIGYYRPPVSGFIMETPPFTKAKATNIKRHPQYYESLLSSNHQTLNCANCHVDVHSYPGRKYDWQVEGDVKCQTCHSPSNHYPQHTTVDCISCHATGFGRSAGLGNDVHDVFRWTENNRVRPLAVKYNEGLSWYPHNIEKPDPTTSCAEKCHYEGNLIGAYVVPVELISFTAQADNRNVILRWITATELNNNGFEIQRGVENSDFVTIGFVRGSGTTTTQNDYSYTDNDLVDSKYFYRLKQVDFSGIYEYSNIVEIDVRDLDEYALEQNYPNPFNPTTNIGYVLKEKNDVKLVLLNGIGEEIEVIVNEQQDKGYHKIAFDASNYPSGVYFYKIKAGVYISVRKMLLIK